MSKFRLPFALLALAILACTMPFAPAPILTQEVPDSVSPTTEIVEPQSTLTATTEPTLAPTDTLQPSASPIVVSGVSDIAYRIPLTVQHITETSAILFFELAAPSEGLLLVTPVDGSGAQQVLPLNAGEARQQIRVENLTQGTHYDVSVGLGTDAASLTAPSYAPASWNGVQFTTQSGAERLRVAVLGDSGFGEQATYDLALQIAGQEPDFVIHTGDAVYKMGDDPSGYDSYRLKWYLAFEPILKQMPIYPVVGNHDIEEATKLNGTPFYYLAFPSFMDSAFEGRNQWYAFSHGSWQFVMLDTQTFFGEAGRAEQDAFLQERLADTRFTHTIPVFHVPPFTSGDVHPHDGDAVQSWVPLFDEANVPLVLSGHNHNYERLQVGDVTYIVTGGGSNSLYGQGELRPESQFFAAKTHFVLFDLYADRIEITAIGLGGEVLDQATIPLQ